MASVANSPASVQLLAAIVQEETMRVNAGGERSMLEVEQHQAARND